MKEDLKKWFPCFLLAGILLNAGGLFNQILEPDGALYAFIAKHIAVTNNWIDLIGDGHDWLDKPHLPFWLCAISFKCFGISAFAYKLPSFLCWLMGVWYTYKLSKAIYNEDIAKLAVIIYITALHVVIANFDVRAEGFLTAFVIAAIYHVYRAMNNKWLWHIVAAALFAALAIMTKGIFVLVTIASGFVIYWIFTKQLNELLKLKWWLLILLTGIFILPELYCLYVQFDLHPEKIVFGHTNVSGIRFFFWDSQFGRFFNNGPIKGSGDKFFFFHTFLWAFLPWSIFSVFAIVALFKKNKGNKKEILIITGSLTVSFIMFSLSKFQLPHYIIIIFPHFAMITAAYLLSIHSPKMLRGFNITQLVIFILMIALVGLLTYISGLVNPYIIISIIAVTTVLFIIYFRGNDLVSFTGKSVCMAGLIALFLNISFYPPLMHYQAGMLAGKWLNAHSTTDTVVMYNCSSYTLEFYANANVAREYSQDSRLPAFLNTNKPVTFFTPLKEIQKLQQLQPGIKILQQFDYFHVTALTGKFIREKTREESLEKYVLAEYVSP